MKIQVLGSGCPKCKKLYELTQEAVQLLKITAKVEYNTDINEIIKLGVMSSPVLAIDGKPVAVGYVPDVKKIQELITESQSGEQTSTKCACDEKCQGESCCKHKDSDKECCSQSTESAMKCGCGGTC